MITPNSQPSGNDPDQTHHADIPIAEKVCVVTGGGQARGTAVAEALARAGAKTVAITYSDDRDAAHEVYVRIQSLGSGCLLAKMDVTDRKSVRQVLLWITDQVGKIDVLVNAEETAWPHEIGSASAGERLQAVGVNIRAQALMADEVLPFMGIQRTGGLVVGVAVDDEVTAALMAFDEPGVPAFVAAAISPMTALAASRQVTMKVLPFGDPDAVAEAVVGLATA
ncbi:MAG: SDR family NAD(P)-dependent oxidoreductase [Dehalococcoidia bacterium]|nr:SDR family NAD(P)-dependent oxidoreductase [Dehalococcoidia bacterium]